MWCRRTPGRNEVPSANVESTQIEKKIVLNFMQVFLIFLLNFADQFLFKYRKVFRKFSILGNNKLRKIEREWMRERKERGRKRKVLYTTRLCMRLSRLRTSHLTVLFHALFSTDFFLRFYYHIFFSSVAQQNPYPLQACRKELRSKNFLYLCSKIAT